MGRTVSLGRRRASERHPVVASVEGVNDVIGDAESALPEDEGWERVYPPPPRESATDVVDRFVEQTRQELAARREIADATHAGVNDDDPFLRDLVAAMTEPVADPEAPADALPSPLAALDPDTLRAALETLKATSDGVVAVIASAARDRDAVGGDRVALEALEVLRAFAARPAAAPAPITVNVPKQDVHVSAPVVNVTVPEQPPQQPPVVHVAAAEAPIVNVTVPAAAPAPAPIVNVTVPETRVDVHVPETQVLVAAPPPRAVRVEFDPAGNKRYVPEDIAEA